MFMGMCIYVSIYVCVCVSLLSVGGAGYARPPLPPCCIQCTYLLDAGWRLSSTSMEYGVWSPERVDMYVRSFCFCFVDCHFAHVPQALPFDIIMMYRASV